MAHHLLIQFSDVHLSVGGELAPGVDPDANLARALVLLEEEGVAPDVVLCTGDLANEGEESSYRAFAAALLASPATAGATIVFVPGNHDRRGSFRTALLGEGPGEGPINQVVWHDGLRIVALDSTVPGADHGHLAPETLAFLTDALRAPAPEGTLVVLHHPPSPSPIAPMAQLRLDNPGDLERAVAGADVRTIICGHYHHAAAGSLGKIPVWMSPSTAFLGDTSVVDEFRLVPGGALTRLDVHESEVVATVVTLAIAPCP